MGDNKAKQIILVCCLLIMAALSSFLFGNNSGTGNSFAGEEIAAGTVKGQERSYSSKAGKKAVKTGKIKVYVTGEVSNPGIYEVENSLRALDVIKVAGGYTDKADLERVNLTRVLRDGSQIKVPALGKKAVQKKINMGEKRQRERRFVRPGKTKVVGDARLVDGYVTKVVWKQGTKVNINGATERELGRLPGIYSELAKRIVVYRQSNVFNRVEDLLKVRGMTRSKLELISPWVELK